MTTYVQQGGLRVADTLHQLLSERICPGTSVAPEAVWAALESIVGELGPKVHALLARRDALQLRLDDWHRQRAGQAHDAVAYKISRRRAI